MNKSIFFIFILLIPTTFALYGGDTWVYHFPECKNNLEINISGETNIDIGEYSILNNCSNNLTLICPCNDDYNLSVKFKLNALNNYTFNFNYEYDKFEVVSSGSSGGSGGSSSRGYNCNSLRNIDSNYCKTFCPKYVKANDCTEAHQMNHLCCVNYFKEEIEPVKEVEEVVNKTVETKINTSTEPIIEPVEINITEEPEQIEEGKINIGMILAIVAIVVFLLILGFWIYKM